MILQKYKKKISTLKKSLSFVYGRYTIAAISRDILFAISTASELYSITLLGKFIDETAKILLSWESFNLTEYLGTKSFLYLVLILALWGVTQICVQAREYFYNVIYERTWEDAKYMMMAKVSRSNLQDVEKEEFQDYLTYAPTFSIDRLITAYSDFSVILSNIIRLIGALVIIWGVAGWWSLILVALVFPEVIAVHLRRREIKKEEDNAVGKFKFLNYIQGVALQISNFCELRVNDTFSFLKRRYTEEYDDFLEGYLKKQANFYQDKTIFSIIDQVFKFAFVILLLAFSIAQRLTIGTFKALYDYVDVAYNSIYSIMNTVSLLANKLEYIDEFFDLIEYEGFGDHQHGNVKLPKGTPLLEFTNLDFAYPDDPDVKILKDLNLVVKPGEKVAFFGGDGSGKSTTVKILSGLYQVVSGDFQIGGHSVKELDRGELKKKIAVTFQDFVNYNFSVLENIVISDKRKKIDEELYKKVYTISKVKDFVKKQKIKESHLLGKTFPGGMDLSPGYWQRLAIARMLYRNKNIFIMDEPFTFIDSISAREILKDIFEFLGKERSLIFITRSTENLKMFDRIYYFEDGKIVEEGTWRSLMKRKGKLYHEVSSLN